IGDVAAEQREPRRSGAPGDRFTDQVAQCLRRAVALHSEHAGIGIDRLDDLELGRRPADACERFVGRLARNQRDVHRARFEQTDVLGAALGVPGLDEQRLVGLIDDGCGIVAAVINETDKSLLIETRNTKGSAENIGLLEAGTMDIALVAGEPAYEAFAGIGRAPTKLKIVQAIYSNPGMFAVKSDSPAKALRDLIGKPIAWGTRASGLTLLGRYVTDGLGLDREKDFQPHYLDKA